LTTTPDRKDRSKSTASSQGFPDIEYPSPLVVKNTFLAAHLGRPASLDDFFEKRQCRSQPGSGIMLPPGLSSDATDGTDGSTKATDDEARAPGKEEETFATPQGSPSATAEQPRLWPSTMSGETLEAMISNASAGGGGLAAAPSFPTTLPKAECASPKKGILKSPDGSPARLSGLCKPAFWPRTLSGDDLEQELRAMAESAASAKDAPPADAGDSPKAVFKPMVWPRTMSGEDLEEMSRTAAQAMLKPKEWPRTMSGEDLEELSRAATQATSQATSTSQAPQTPSNKVCLSTTPASRNKPSSSQCASAGARNLAVPPPPQLPPKIKEADSSSSMPPAPAKAAPIFEEESLPPPPTGQAPSAADAKKVSIADTLPEPEIGTAERPTIGSWGHGIGKCKPCAFLHTKGCKNGVECPFCHLCDRGEKKRRQREKWQAARETANVAAVVAQQQAFMSMPGMRPPVPGMPPMGVAPALSSMLHLPPMPLVPPFMPPGAPAASAYPAAPA